MSDPLVTVMRCARVVSWPQLGEARPEQAYLCRLSTALDREFTTDAHFSPYVSTPRRRLNRRAVQELGQVELHSIVFDCDCADVHGTTQPAPDSWRHRVRDAVQALFLVHPNGYFYETRGGARIVYGLPEPTVLRSVDDEQSWSIEYVVACAYLERRFGLVADRACKDWTRLYRLPRATRDPGGAPENWPTCGDPRQIGVLTIDADQRDLIRAREQAAQVFRPRKHLQFAPGTGDGSGLFFWLLRARGHLGKEAPRGGWLCICPNNQAHRTNSDGTDRTVCFPPAAGKELGWIHCFRGSCDSFGVRRWLSFFSDQEIEAARKAAGITRAA